MRSNQGELQQVKTQGHPWHPRIYLKQGYRVISPWHDVPLYGKKGNLHYICEIPKGRKEKMEVATDEERTPIRHDVQNTKSGFYPFPIRWNYGLLPQTWEDPDQQDQKLGIGGDNDPLDVMEFSSKVHHQGGIYEVKPLGAYAMIDDGELDWKVLAISLDDPKAGMVNDIADVEKHFPGELEAIKVWLSKYKQSEGRSLVEFGYDGKCLDRNSAHKLSGGAWLQRGPLVWRTT